MLRGTQRSGLSILQLSVLPDVDSHAVCHAQQTSFAAAQDETGKGAAPLGQATGKHGGQCWHA